jgi:hypothetical protein
LTGKTGIHFFATRSRDRACFDTPRRSEATQHDDVRFVRLGGDRKGRVSKHATLQTHSARPRQSPAEIIQLFEGGVLEPHLALSAGVADLDLKAEDVRQIALQGRGVVVLDRLGGGLGR